MGKMWLLALPPNLVIRLFSEHLCVEDVAIVEECSASLRNDVNWQAYLRRCDIFQRKYKFVETSEFPEQRLNWVVKSKCSVRNFRICLESANATLLSNRQRYLEIIGNGVPLNEASLSSLFPMFVQLKYLVLEDVTSEVGPVLSNTAKSCPDLQNLTIQFEEDGRVNELFMNDLIGTILAIKYLRSMEINVKDINYRGLDQNKVFPFAKFIRGSALGLFCYSEAVLRKFCTPISEDIASEELVKALRVVLSIVPYRVYTGATFRTVMVMPFLSLARLGGLLPLLPLHNTNARCCQFVQQFLDCLPNDVEVSSLSTEITSFTNVERQESFLFTRADLEARYESSIREFPGELDSLLLRLGTRRLVCHVQDLRHIEHLRMRYFTGRSAIDCEVAGNFSFAFNNDALTAAAWASLPVEVFSSLMLRGALSLEGAEHAVRCDRLRTLKVDEIKSASQGLWCSLLRKLDSFSVYGFTAMRNAATEVLCCQLNPLFVPEPNLSTLLQALHQLQLQHSQRVDVSVRNVGALGLDRTRLFGGNTGGGLGPQVLQRLGGLLRAVDWQAQDPIVDLQVILACADLEHVSSIVVADNFQRQEIQFQRGQKKLVLSCKCFAVQQLSRLSSMVQVLTIRGDTTSHQPNPRLHGCLAAVGAFPHVASLTVQEMNCNGSTLLGLFPNANQLRAITIMHCRNFPYGVLRCCELEIHQLGQLSVDEVSQLQQTIHSNPQLTRLTMNIIARDKMDHVRFEGTTKFCYIFNRRIVR